MPKVLQRPVESTMYTAQQDERFSVQIDTCLNFFKVVTVAMPKEALRAFVPTEIQHLGISPHTKTELAQNPNC